MFWCPVNDLIQNLAPFLQYVALSFLIQNLAPFLLYVALSVVLISLKNQKKNKKYLIKHIARYTHSFNFRFYEF